MIDVIIPAYNAHNTIDKTLMSIAIQDYADKLKVYIVNDASEQDYKTQIEFFSKFLDIKEFKLKKNRGPGYARQYGIDHSSSDYIIFIDSDDVLLNFQSVTQLYKNIVSDDYDVVSGVFFEELDSKFQKHCNDTIFMHGKIYKRKFLLDNKIRFNNTYSNEDNGFNSLIILHEGKIKFIQEEIYVWRNNKSSITRRNNYEYTVMGIEGYIYNINWAVSLAIKRGCNGNRISEVTFGSLLAVYYYYIKLKNEYIIKWALPLCKLYLKYPPNDKIKDELFWSVFNQNVERCNNSVIVNPIITFDQFVEKVMLYDSGNEL